MKLGLALAGGGVKGAAHIGIIQALEENNIKVDMISGTSSGSIVASLYAMGYNAKEMLNLFNYSAKAMIESNPSYIFSSMRENKSLMVDGMRSGYNIETILNEIARYKNIERIGELQLPTIIPTVDIKDGKEYIFTNAEMEGEKYIKDISIGKAVRASASFPVYFAPLKFEDHIFVDGGVLNNVPISELKKAGADKVIGVNFFVQDTSVRNNMYSIAIRTIDIMSNKIAEKDLKKSDYTIVIDTGEIRILDISKINKCYKRGYEYTMEHIDEIKKIIAD